MLSMSAMVYHRRVWFNTGLWHEPGQPRWYFWYTAFLVVFVYFMFPLFIGVQLAFTNTVDEFTDILLILPTAAFGIKAALVAVNHPKIARLFEILDKIDGFVVAPTHRAIVQQQIEESRKLVLLLSGEYYTSVSAHFLVAVLSGTALMWPSWYPVDYANQRFWYYAINVYQYVSSLLNAYVFSSIDLYGIALYKLLGAHFDVLALQLAAVGYGDRVEQQPALTAPEERRWWRANEHELGRCIEYHVYCCEFASKLNEIISVQYFLQFGMSIAIICGSEFKIISIDPAEDIVHYILVIGYMLGLLFEIFLPCYVGTIVLHKSSQMLGAIYKCNWLEQTPRFKSALLIFGERAKQPVEPIAGGLFPLEMSMFMSTMKLAYSMIAVLKTME